MPQSGQKLIYRFFQTLQVQAIGGHTLNPQLWIHQLRGARTHTDTQFHPPTSNTASFSTWGIRHTSESPFYMGEKNLQSIKNRSYPLPLCGSSTPCMDQGVPVSGIAQSRGGCWLWEACGSHKCGKHQHQHGKFPQPSTEGSTRSWSNSCPLQRMVLISNSLQHNPHLCCGQQSLCGTALLVLSDTFIGLAHLFLLINQNQSEVVEVVFNPLHHCKYNKQSSHSTL